MINFRYPKKIINKISKNTFLAIEERIEKTKIEEQRIKEWEVKFDAERKKSDEAQSLMEEELKRKDDERKLKIEYDYKNQDKPN